jgi:hypothetical protein
MPLLLLTLLIALTGCSKSKNEIVGTNFEKKDDQAVVAAEKQVLNEFDKRPLLILPHKNEESRLRNKLIEQFINRELKTNQNIEIDSFDELQFSGSVVRDQFDIQDFQIKSKELTRVYVSNASNFYAYLVPINIPIEKIADRLEINPEEGRKLILMTSSEGATKAGQAIYFLSVNHEDLIAHDRLSYSEQFKVDTKSNSHQLKLRYGQKATLLFDVNYYVQALYVQQFNGLARKCTPDLSEAGACDICTFNREVPSSELKLFKATSLDELGIELTVGNQNFASKEMGITFSESRVELKLDVNNFTKEAEVDFKFNFKPGAQSVSTKDYNFAAWCQSKSPNVKTDLLQTKVLSTYSAKVWGRGSLLKTIKL